MTELCVEDPPIRGGFYLKARCIQEASIAHAPPHVREIWDWLIMKASYRPRPGDSLERGQLLTSYEEIRNGLSWRVGYRVERYSKWDCEKAMKYLTKEGMITTAKTTRGFVITICKYGYYQNPDNYESHSENHTKATREPQTPSIIGKKGKKYISPSGDMSPTNGDCPHQRIIDLYHKHLPMCPQVVQWTPTRAKHLKARWREDKERQDLSWWDDFFQQIAQSKFLTGRTTDKKTGRPFFAYLAWIVKPENFVKILESLYHD